MTKQPVYSAEERRNLVEVLYNQSKALHPWWDTGRELPKPIYPVSLKDVDLSKKQMAQLPMTDIQTSVLCGTIFGDTSFTINKGYKNARMQNRHSTRQASWFFWKWMICLRTFINGLSSITFQNPDGKQLASVPACYSQKSSIYQNKLNPYFFQKSKMVKKTYGFFEGTKTSFFDMREAQEGGGVYFEEEREGEILGKLKISSKATPTLTELHKLVCENNKKKIERFWLNHMNNYFLMTLWLDDGSLYHQRQGVFCLDLIQKGQQQVLAQYLKTVWNIDCYVKQQPEIMTSTNTYGYRVHIANQESLLNLLRVVAPIVPVKEMLYKVMFVPENNRDLLQRWASELETLVYPEFQQYIKGTYQKILLDYMDEQPKA